MSKLRKLWLTGAMLALGCLMLAAFSSVSLRAAEDKKKTPDKTKEADKKKKETVKTTDVLPKVKGELKENDPKDARTNNPSQKFKATFSADKTYQIDLKSDDFDTFLRLLDAKGKEVAFDDDGGGGLNSRIVFPSKGGDFTIVVTSFDGKVGKFEVNTVAQDAKAATAKSKFPSKPIDLKLTDGKGSYKGELTEKDGTAFGRRYKVFTVTFEEGRTYRIDYRNAGENKAFDPLLILEDADGVQMDVDDDGGGGLNSRIVHKATKSAVHRLVAITLPKTPETGKFVLEVTPETDKKELKSADLRYKAATFAKLTPAQRKTTAEDLAKHLSDRDGELTVGDLRTAFMLGMEAELEDIELARQVYKESIKHIAAARDEKISSAAGQLEAALKAIEKIGTVIEIAGKTTDGKDIDLKNLKGKVVLVDFWGTWCPPCVAEIPNIVQAHKKYHGKGFEVIGVTSDRNDDVVVNFMKSRSLPWACINVEDSRTLIDKYSVMSYPTTMLVDQKGRLVSMRARGPQLERLLARLLDVKK